MPIPRILPFIALLFSWPAVASEPLKLPLEVPLNFIEGLAAQSLGLDANGQATLSADACNRLELDDLNLESVDDSLTLDLAIRAHTGASAFGRCTGPRPVNSRLRVQLAPRLSGDNMGVTFTPERMEVLGADGRSGLLAAPSRLLADSLILPRLGAMQIDLAASLTALDETLEAFLASPDAAGPRLREWTRIERFETIPDGMRMTLALSIEPRAPATESEPALAAEELLEWQRIEDELDGFLTVILAALATQSEGRDLQIGLLGTLIDARRRIAEALANDGDESGITRDPVRELFLDTWRQLQPHLAELGKQASVDLQLAAFISAGDALVALDALGPEFGLEISRDGLRRMARMLLADQAPPAFTPLPLDVDPQLRTLFGMESLEPVILPPTPSLLSRLGTWLVPVAHAETPSPGDALRGLVPRLAYLDDYLVLVDQLLHFKVNTRMDDATRVPEEYFDLFDPMVRATAWKESCWRHYVGTADAPVVIRSPVGAVGMMQIMGRVWRGVYDIERLESEVEYNVAAGIEILEHYLVDYALRRGEHEQPGGRDNLVRATYAAYNGGPSHLGRYRREDTPGRLRAIDNAFWRDFEQMRSEQWPDVAGCYSVD